MCALTGWNFVCGKFVFISSLVLKRGEIFFLTAFTCLHMAFQFHSSCRSVNCSISRRFLEFCLIHQTHTLTLSFLFLSKCASIFAFDFFSSPNTERHSQRAARAVKRMASTARPKVQPYILFNLHQRQPNMFHLSANLVCCELCSFKRQLFPTNSTQR